MFSYINMAKALSFKRQHVDIYSNSWGLDDDDGKTVSGPRPEVEQVLQDGTKYGRGGRGSIFIFAAGNGGEKDSCSCDGFQTSVYTITISSVSDIGAMLSYSETCPSILATTFSGFRFDPFRKRCKIVSTDINKGCTDTVTGTSASAAMASGIVALTLEANPNLTWRDVQHIVVRTARSDRLQGVWIVNGVGRYVSDSFGFGIMDTAAMVKLSKNWTNVPPQHICREPSSQTDIKIPRQGDRMRDIYTTGCSGTGREVNYLEHVKVKMTLATSQRGEVEIHLISPMGTRSTLLTKRPEDLSNEGFVNWEFMTTHLWGETARGKWTLHIVNGKSETELIDWSLVLFGTQEKPQ